MEEGEYITFRTKDKELKIDLKEDTTISITDLQNDWDCGWEENSLTKPMTVKHLMDILKDITEFKKKFENDFIATQNTLLNSRVLNLQEENEELKEKFENLKESIKIVKTETEGDRS